MGRFMPQNRHLVCQKCPTLSEMQGHTHGNGHGGGSCQCLSGNITVLYMHVRRQEAETRDVKLRTYEGRKVRLLSVLLTALLTSAA